MKKYIEIDKSILEMPEAKARILGVFLLLTLKSNWDEEKEWNGKHIPKGSYIASRKELLVQTGLSRYQLDLVLNKLIMAGAIEIEKLPHTKKLIKIKKYVNI